MRWIGAGLFTLVAILFALVGLSLPLTLPRQAAADRVYYEQFKLAADYVDRNGNLPTGSALQELGYSPQGMSIWPSLTITPLNCDPTFAKERSDRFVLSFWRGEWSECFAYPSGKTTLPMSVEAYLLSGLGVDLAVYWLIAAGAGWAAWRLGRRKQ